MTTIKRLPRPPETPKEKWCFHRYEKSIDVYPASAYGVRIKRIEKKCHKCGQKKTRERIYHGL